MNVRRVVAAVGTDGKSRFVEDGAAPHSFDFDSAPGNSTALVWATFAAETLSAGANGTDPTPKSGFVPGAGETRLMIVEFPPLASMMRADFDGAAFGAEFFKRMPDFAMRFEPDNPGMHTTDSIDYDVVLEGEITLELDEGKTVSLKKHDVAVQYGTRHAWRNLSDKPAKLLFVLMGAARA